METFVALLIYFVKKCLKEQHPSLVCELQFVLIFYCTRCIENYTGKILHIVRMRIRFSFCVLKLILPTYRPNFAEVARTT